MVVEWVAVENLRSAELCTASIARAFSPPSLFFSLALYLTVPFSPSRRSSLSLFQFSRTLYISLYRSLRDEAFVLVARCDARRCAVRALRVKP